MYKHKSNKDYDSLNIMKDEYDLDYFIKDNIPKTLGVGFRNIEQEVVTIGEETLAKSSQCQSKK